MDLYFKSTQLNLSVDFYWFTVVDWTGIVILINDDVICLIKFTDPQRPATSVFATSDDDVVCQMTSMNYPTSNGRTIECSNDSTDLVGTRQRRVAAASSSPPIVSSCLPELDSSAMDEPSDAAADVEEFLARRTSPRATTMILIVYLSVSEVLVLDADPNYSSLASDSTNDANSADPPDLVLSDDVVFSDARPDRRRRRRQRVQRVVLLRGARTMKSEWHVVYLEIVRLFVLTCFMFNFAILVDATFTDQSGGSELMIVSDFEFASP